MENQENKHFSNKVEQVIEKMEQKLPKYEQAQKDRYLVKLGLYTSGDEEEKIAIKVTDEEYQALLKYKDMVNEGNDRFSGLLKGMGCLFLLIAIIVGFIGIGMNSILVLVLSLWQGFTYFLILYGLGIAVENSYKRK